MTNNKRKFFVSIAAALLCAASSAQSLYVKQSDGAVHEFTVESVQEVVFGSSSGMTKQRTVTYAANDGSEATFAISAAEGSLVSVDRGTSLSRDGFTLVGWNTSADGSGAFCALGSLLPLTADVTLYAQWEKKAPIVTPEPENPEPVTPKPELRTITYMVNDGSGATFATTVDHGTMVSVDGGSTLTRDGFTLKGWNTAADGSGSVCPLSGILTLTADMTLYAQWEKTAPVVTPEPEDPEPVTPESRTIKYMANDGSGASFSSTVDHGTMVSVDGGSTLSRDGFTLKGWNTAADGSGSVCPLSGILTLTADVTLYAQWEKIIPVEVPEPVMHTIKYVLNDGTDGAFSSTVDHGTMVNVDGGSSLTRDGFTLKGWNTAADGTGSVCPLSGILTLTADVTLYAQWEEILPVEVPEPVMHTIKYVFNDGTDGAFSSTVDHGTMVSIDGGSSLVRDGFTLKGWNTAADGSGSVCPLSGILTLTADVTLYAQWEEIVPVEVPEPETRTIKYVPNDGTDITTSNSVAIGSMVVVDRGDKLIRDGFELKGWNTAADGSGATCALGSLLTLTDNVTLYAMWEKKKVVINERTVTYMSNDGDGKSHTTKNLKGVVVTVGQGVDYKRRGYEMTGWNTDVDGNGTQLPTGTNILFDEDVTLYAQWNKLEGQGVENGHDWIDLGLTSGTMWATCNMGAAVPEGKGDYFAWGETEVKDSYTIANYAHANTTDYKAVYLAPPAGNDPTYATLKPEHDAAHVLWGGRWQMPTIEQIDELIKECEWTWTDLNGVNGFKVVGPNGRTIFLPAAGGKNGSSVVYNNLYGDFWSNKFDVSNDANAFYLAAGKSGNTALTKRQTVPRYTGRSIRPVMLP